MGSATLWQGGVGAGKPEPGRVGPNAVLQLAEALIALYGPSFTARIFADAGFGGLLASPPETMIDETVPAALFRALWRDMPPVSAARVARNAGTRTADYILANRIPAIAKAVLKVLPPRLAAPLLLSAIRKHAWTFAGSGTCETDTRGGYRIDIRRNPLAMPDCVWHQGVFERLFRVLVSSRAHVHHTKCCADGAPLCRFEVRL
ncbi:MAG: bacteriochlorophyll 4-vinyl reductase [Pseudomonadota bacterium]